MKTKCSRKNIFIPPNINNYNIDRRNKLIFFLFTVIFIVIKRFKQNIFGFKKSEDAARRRRENARISK